MATMTDITCSNCGLHGERMPTIGIRDGLYSAGWRALGDALYCPDCVNTWTERNGKEFNEYVKDPPHQFAMWWNRAVEKSMEGENNGGNQMDGD